MVLCISSMRKWGILLESNFGAAEKFQSSQDFNQVRTFQIKFYKLEKNVII